jgi:hypothetical protein
VKEGLGAGVNRQLARLVEDAGTGCGRGLDVVGAGLTDDRDDRVVERARHLEAVGTGLPLSRY